MKNQIDRKGRRFVIVTQNLERGLKAALFTLICCCLVGGGGKLLAQGSLNIDLINGRFDGKALSSLTVDDVTKRLGSPSASTKLPELVGVRMYYHELGLAFVFRTEPTNRFLSVDLYLSPTLDSPRRIIFAPYSGTLIPNVNSNSTLEQTQEELKKHPSAKGLSVRDSHRRLGAAGRLAPVQVIELRGNSGNVRFFHDQATRLLEQITAANPG